MIRWIRTYGMVILIVVTLICCESSIQPIVGDDRPFTIWGYLDAHADLQRVRVFTVEDRLGHDRSGSIDAVVTSKNLITGESHAWDHREVTFSDSTVGHVFEAKFKANYEESYRLIVRRSDGVESTAEVTIPPPVLIELMGERDRANVPIKVIGKLPNLVDVHVLYDAITLPPVFPWPPGSTAQPGVRLPVEVSYSGKEKSTSDGWNLEVNLREDFAEVQDQFDRNCLSTDHIALRRIHFRFFAADQQWSPPNGSFDPNILVEPGTFSNIDNGYGFFGGGYTVSAGWFPSLIVQRNIGFRTASPCAMGARNIPECQLFPEPCLSQGE